MAAYTMAVAGGDKCVHVRVRACKCLPATRALLWRLHDNIYP